MITIRMNLVLLVLTGLTLTGMSGGNPTKEPVAKPLVLQLAGGAKLRPTEDRLVRRGTKAASAALELNPHLAGLMTFGITSYESANYSSIAEDGENEHDQTKMPNCEHFDWETRVLNVPISCIRSVSAGYRERSGAVVRPGFAITSKEKNPSTEATPTIYSSQAREDGLQLINSSEKGDVEAVKSLLEKGVYIHAQDREGRCAIVAAAYKNRLEIVDLLIAAGADVNMKDNTLQSAYLISAMEGYADLLKKTLKAGADVHSTDSDNGTGLIRAADRGHVEIISELLKTNIRVNHVNRLGWTALLEAILLGDGGKRHTEVVRLLVAAGADVNLPDKNGTTPLSHAKNKSYADIVEILEKASK